MGRMAAAYTLEKMRKTLNDLRSNVAARMEAQKIAQAQSNQTSNFRENSSPVKSTDKRNSNSAVEVEGESLVTPIDRAAFSSKLGSHFKTLRLASSNIKNSLAIATK